MKNKMLAMLCLVLSITMLFAGCSGSSLTGNAYETAAQSDYAYPEEYPEEYAEESLLSGSEIDSSALSSRKIIRNISIELETREFDKATEDIMRLTELAGGYVENSNVWGNSIDYDYYDYNQRSADYILRIPEDKLDQTVNELGSVYNQTYRSESVEDITDIYYDVDSRLASLRVQEERLLSMLEQAGTLEDMLTLESYLADVRYQIEGLTGDRNRMDSQVEFATLHINLLEVVEYSEIAPDTFGQRVADTFSDSLVFIVEFGQNVLLLLVAILPFVIVYGGIIAVVVFVIIKVAKRIGMNRAKKRANMPQPTMAPPIQQQIQNPNPNQPQQQNEVHRTPSNPNNKN